jgi:adenylate kinase
MNIIMIGPQGSGKGTQADLLGPKIGAIKLSTGDLFRAHIAQETSLGLKVKEILASGNLVSDDITLAMVDGRLDEIAADGIGGVIFDGFPRTAAQAEGLDRLLEQRGQHIDRVIELTVPDNVLIERMSGRRMCSECGATYNLAFQSTNVEGRCDKCGGQLIQREDDLPESIRKRLQLYNELTKPLLDFYGARNLVTTIDGNQDVETVQQAILDALAAAAVDQTA